ncbi:MAG: DUF4157 domain-containing protein [Ardenticatenaceae bacterium]|nr:DUF4157 domain-containing protein [Ardenticatenaceae bacterium]
MVKEQISKPAKKRVHSKDKGSVAPVVQAKRAGEVSPDNAASVQPANGGHASSQVVYASFASILENRDRVSHEVMGGERPFVQTKLTLGPVGDKYEQEADSVAKQVVNTINQPTPAPVQRQEDEDEEVMTKRVQRQEDEEMVQMETADPSQTQTISPGIETHIENQRGGGQPLAKEVRAPMEQAFGADFSSVQIHTSSQSDTLNRSLQARAFTSGQDIFFRQGEYNPGSSSGQELLAHELTHVVQQNAAPANSPIQRNAHQPTAGCNCPACTGLQRKPKEGETTSAIAARPTSGGPAMHGAVQQKAEGPIIQRDILKDWETEHKVYYKNGKEKKASKQMKKLTTAVDAYNKRPRRMYDARKADLDLIQTRINEWRASKHKKDPTRVAKVNLLEQTIPVAKGLVDHQQAEEARQVQEANERRDRFMLLEPELAQFASRPAPDVSNFMPGQTYATDPLTMPRALGGKLSPQAIVASESAKQKEKDENLRLGDTGSVTVDPSLGESDLNKIIAEQLNTETEETLYPELKNLTEQNNKQDEIRTKVVNMGNTTVTVRYNPSDVNFDARLNLVKTAFDKVASAGFTIPPIDVNLPKMGRKLTVTSTCEVKTSDKSNRAVFVPPAFMHISSENVQNPLTDKSSKDPNKFKNLSTELDPAGAGTIVHELGHLLHYSQVPGKYYGLSEAQFKDNVTGERAIREVSEYGSNPREMVAEVFLGMVYGRTFGREVMDMYRAFGGPVKG